MSLMTQTPDTTTPAPAVNGHIYIDADGAVAPASSWAAQELGRRKVYVG